MIIADSREPSELTEHCDLVMCFEKGDYWVCGNGRIVRVERKTLTDLYSTVTEGRLNGQLEGVDILLVENNPFVPNEVYNIITSEKIFDIIDGVAVHHIVLISLGTDHTLRILRRLEHKLQDGTYREMRREITIIGGVDQREAVLAQIPGIGEELAGRILAKYGTLQQALSEIGHWDEVPGIGPRKLERIRKFLGVDA